MKHQKESEKDLTEPPSEIVKANQKVPAGERLIINFNGLNHEMFFDEDLFILERLEKKMRSEMGWFERISSHAPSVGSFYESLIQDALETVMPSSVRIGSGFVYDTEKRIASPQVDFIIYTDSENPPIYRRNNFVVIDASNVISCIEIKKTLTKSILRKVISSYINSNLGTSPHSYYSVQFLNIFAFQSTMSIQMAYECVIEELRKYFIKFYGKTKGGDVGYFLSHHIVLPNIFFFDRVGCIRSECKPTDDGRYFKIELRLNTSYTSKNSLGEFLDFVMLTSKEKRRFNKKNFLSHSIYQTELETIVHSKFALSRKLSMENIIKYFPNEIEDIKKGVGANGIQPYGALVSPVHDLTKIGLRDLEKTPGFSWLVPEPKL